MEACAFIELDLEIKIQLLEAKGKWGIMENEFGITRSFSREALTSRIFIAGMYVGEVSTTQSLVIDDFSTLHTFVWHAIN